MKMSRGVSDGLKSLALLVAWFLTTAVGLFIALNMEPRFGLGVALTFGVTVPVLLVFSTVAASRLRGRYISYDDLDAVKAYVRKLEGKSDE